MNPHEPSLENEPQFSGLAEKLKEYPIELLEKKSDVSFDELQKQFPEKTIIVVDSYVADIEEADKIVGGFQKKNVINIDHHAPVNEMQRQISSTNLAIEYVKKNGSAPKDAIVATNHLDCDAILSTAIIRGILPPEDRFGQAAIAADHTGAENKIADLLQSFYAKRDVEFCLKNLELLLNNEKIDPEAQRLLDKRFDDRKKAQELVKSNIFKQENGIYYTEIDEKIDAGLLIALLPKAKIIIVATPLRANPEKWEIKIRLGLNAPTGYFLNTKLIRANVDKNYGGRWNAGANSRPSDGIPGNAGTNIKPEEYVKKLNEILG